MRPESMNDDEGKDEEVFFVEKVGMFLCQVLFSIPFPVATQSGSLNRSACHFVNWAGRNVRSTDKSC